MVNTSRITGILLILLGLISYFITGMESITALIPAFIGIIVVILAWLAGSESRHKIMMHITVVLIFIGFLGSVSGIPKTVGYLSGQPVARPAAAVSQSIMAVICLVYLAMAVNSFISARRSESDKE